MRLFSIYNIELLFWIVIVSISIYACESGGESSIQKNYEERNEQSKYKVRIGDIEIYNSFIAQIDANKSSSMDSSLIIDSVYHVHKLMWDSCYGQIFGEENAPKFQTDAGMIDWNYKLFNELDNNIDSIVDIVYGYDIDSLFEFHLQRFEDLGYQTPKAKISIVFTPFPGIGFGGCSNDQFILELNNPDFEIIYTLEKGLPHELFHFINEQELGKQNEFTAIDLAINEGLACHFTREYFKGEITKYEAVEDMSAEDWKYYVENEKLIYAQVKDYFLDTTGDNPLLQPKKFNIFPDAPRSLHYWIGYRIVESYLNNNPNSSIKELSSIPYQVIFEKSKYSNRFSE